MSPSPTKRQRSAYTFPVNNNVQSTTSASTSISSSSTTPSTSEVLLPRFDSIRMTPTVYMQKCLATLNEWVFPGAYMIRPSVDITSTPNYTMLYLLRSFAVPLFNIKPDFRLIQVNNGKKIPNTELLPESIENDHVDLYTTPVESFDYNGRKIIRFTFFVQTSQPFLGGWLYNWFRRPRGMPRLHQVRCVPLLCTDYRSVCWFLYSFMDTINIENLKDYINTVVFGRDVPMYIYETGVYLSITDNTDDEKVRALTLEVADVDYEFVCTKFFHRTSSDPPLFQGKYHNLAALPHNLSKRDNFHRRCFSAHRLLQKSIATVEIEFASAEETIHDVNFYAHVLRSRVSPNSHFLGITLDRFGDKLIIAGLVEHNDDLRRIIDEGLSANGIKCKIAPKSPAQIKKESFAFSRRTQVVNLIDSDEVSIISASSASTRMVSPAGKRDPPVSHASFPPLSMASSTTTNVEQVIDNKLQPFREEVDKKLKVQNSIIAAIERNQRKQQESQTRNKKKLQDLSERHATHKLELGKALAALDKRLLNTQNDLTDTRQELQDQVENVSNTVAENYSATTQSINRVAASHNALVFDLNNYIRSLSDPQTQPDSPVHMTQFEQIDLDVLEINDPIPSSIADPDDLSESPTFEDGMDTDD